jgi:hypothetical protein
MRQKEKDVLGAPSSEVIFDKDDQVATNLTWGAHANLKGVLPHDWTQCVDRIEVSIKVDIADGVKKDCCFTVKPNNGQFVVPNLRTNGYSSANVSMEESNPFVQTYAHVYVDSVREKHKIDLKWSEIKEQVIKFLKSAKSLNEALKLWPALALYISDSYIQRVNDKVSRGGNVSKAAEILAQIQTDNLTAAAVSAKLS